MGRGSLSFGSKRERRPRMGLIPGVDFGAGGGTAFVFGRGSEGS